MDKKQKSMLVRVLLTILLLIVIAFLPAEGMLQALLYLLPYFVIGHDILRKALRGIFHGEVFDENFLMAIATSGAMILGEYTEGVAVMLLYQIGELFQVYAVGRSRQNIGQLMDIRPDYANLEQEGTILRVDPDDVEIGSTIVVRPGERIPLDGIILEGNTFLDMQALTGESVPCEAKKGDTVLSGSINKTGVLRIETTKEADEGTAAKILELVENSALRKSKSERFITRFARVYTPIVCVIALFIAVGIPLVRLFFLNTEPLWSMWVERALILLVISCPCALVISVPLSFFGGIGGASASGILVKGGNYLEALANVSTVVFDKTGTLTKGQFAITSVFPKNFSKEEMLSYAVAVEAHSNHPLSQSIKDTAGVKPFSYDVTDYEEIGGYGVKALVHGKMVAAGSKRLMEEIGINVQNPEETGTAVHVAIDGTYAGVILLNDQLKENSATAIASMKEKGIEKTVMLTGDTKETAQKVATALGIDEVHAGLLPAQKVEEMENLLKLREESRENMNGKKNIAFVGDGINDAPVLSRADIGIAMGALGSDAAIEAADVVLMDDDPRKITTAIEIAKNTMAIVRQNIALAIGIKVLFLLLGALGYANMWLAIFADVGVTVIAILNAIRALKVQKPKKDTMVEKTSAVSVAC